MSIEHLIKQKKKDMLLAAVEISKKGYSGILPPSGKIVDRRDHPEAIPIQKNNTFGVPTPKYVGQKRWPADPVRSTRKMNTLCTFAKCDCRNCCKLSLMQG